MKTILSLIIVLLTIGAAQTHAQTTAKALESIRASGDFLADGLEVAARKGDAKSSLDFAKALATTQVVELKAMDLIDAREASAQTMTRSAMTRALAEAKEMGVAASLRDNARINWAAARSPAAAAALVDEVADATMARMVVVRQMGGFRRSIPAWLGGPTAVACANAAPVADAETRIAALEAKIKAP